MRIRGVGRVVPLLAALLLIACGERARSTTQALDDPNAQKASHAGAALSALDTLVRRAPAVAATLGPKVAQRPKALVRAGTTPAEDDATRGRIVSEGWRATQQQRIDLLGARLPDTADGPIDLGPSRFEDLHAHVQLLGASPRSAAQLEAGRVVYPNVLPGTDRILLSGASFLEELLVLRDASAPRAFTWKIQLSSGLSRITEHDGAYWFEDAAGRPKLVMRAPAAYDAAGARLPLRVQWEEASRSLRLALPATDALAYPVIVDPEYATDAWFDVAQLSPAGRWQHGLAFDSARGELVLFGGANDAGDLDDTWVCPSATRVCAKRTPAVHPPARRGATLTYDSARNETILFGGSNPLAGLLADTWIWNGSTWSQRVPASAPEPRSQHAAAYDAVRREVVIFGGSADAGKLSDTWVWNGATWTKRTAGPSPGPRVGHALAFDAAHGETVLFGDIYNLTLTETWIWNGTIWAQRSPPTAPPPVSFGAMSYLPALGEVVLMGARENVAADTWSWNGTTWTLRSPSAPIPHHLAAAMALDTTRGEVVLFGGRYDGGRYDSDAWTWAGGASPWIPHGSAISPRSNGAMAFDSSRGEVVYVSVTPETNPGVSETWVWTAATRNWSRRLVGGIPPRTDTAMAYDALRGVVTLFGGSATGAGLDDTWIWNGAASTWSRADTTAGAPPGRSGHAMVYDAARGETVLFGGYTPLLPNDTWVWTGTAWSQRTTANAPAGRIGAAMAYDPARREVLLFGGRSAAIYADTWVWNGASWTARSPAIAPPARSASAIAFDGAQNQLVLFGGDSGSGILNDTWTWNGITWLQRTPLGAPRARSAHAMASDGITGELVLFGGTEQFSSFGDTWVHQTLGGMCTANAECLENAFCVDGACCNLATCGTCRTCGGTSPGRCAPVTNREDPDSCAEKDGTSCNDLGDCKAKLGTATTNATDCASGLIVDGVCCATASCPACQTCDVTKTASGLNPGRCDYVRAGTDPKEDCADERANTCGNDGTCDGSGRCRKYRHGTPCGNNVCSRNASTGQFCSGAGECAASNDVIDCRTYACIEGACRTACSVVDDCAPLHHCENAICVQDRGAACSPDGHTVVSPQGMSVDCAPYRCTGATCRVACTSKTDCAGDAECTNAGSCVPFGAPIAAAADGGCSVYSTRFGIGRGASGPWLLLAGAGAFATRRRRKRARAA